MSYMHFPAINIAFVTVLLFLMSTLINTWVNVLLANIIFDIFVQLCKVLKLICAQYTGTAVIIFALTYNMQ